MRKHSAGFYYIQPQAPATLYIYGVNAHTTQYSAHLNFKT